MCWNDSMRITIIVYIRGNIDWTNVGHYRVDLKQFVAYLQCCKCDSHPSHHIEMIFQKLSDKRRTTLTEDNNNFLNMLT